MAHGVWWEPHVDPASMQLDCIRAGGKWLNKSTGEMAGEGNYYHYRKFQEIVWPERIWEKGPFKNYWAEKILEGWLEYKYFGLMGCAACVRGSTEILNPITGESAPIADLCSSNTKPVVMTAFGPEEASVPFIKGTADLYEVTTASGHKFTSTLNHLVLLPTGVFSRVSDLQCGQQLLVAEPFPPLSTSGHGRSIHLSDASRCSNTGPDSQCDCRPCFCFDDEQPHALLEAFPGSSTSPDDVLEHRFGIADAHWGVLGNKQECIRSYQSPFHPSIDGSCSLKKIPETFYPPHTFSKMAEHGARPLRPSDISLLLNNLRRSFSKPSPDFSHMQNHIFSCDGLWAARDVVESIKYVATEQFYDIAVPNAHHYYADGFIHHNSGKSDSLGAICLTDWYPFSDCTTTIVSSTELAMLQRRIWGFIEKYHRLAKKRCEWLPGHLVQSKLSILQNSKDEDDDYEGRSHINAIFGVPCKRGNTYTGLGSFVGLHNKRVRLIADEAMLMPKTFLDSTSNLSKCPDFKLVAPGNPNETTNAHGMICEPAEELGGWEGGIDQSPGTKFWKTRYPNGGCLQLPGGDSPNLKAPQSEEAPFPFICTREHIAEEAAIWGSGDWHFDMFINAKMPRGQGSNRIITRQECEKHGATLEPFWRDSNITKIASLDAAYRSSGGDRCVFTEINFGRESESTPGLMAQGALAFQNSNAPQGRQIMALVDQVVIPIDGGTTADTPEAQIRKFCQSQCAARGIPPENFFLDSGMRTSLVQEMSRNWSVDIQSIDCGAAPTDQRVSAEIDIPCHDYYKKLITQIWFSVRLIIIARQFRNLSKDAMWELCAREWKTTSGNKIEAESKLEMKEKTGKSPDLGDGLCLAAFGATKRGFQISTLRAQKPQAGNRGPDWRDKLREKSRKIWSSGQLEYSEA